MAKTQTDILQMPPSEATLHAYIDNELAPEARLRVAEWLLANPEAARKLQKIELREEILRLSLRVGGEAATTDSRVAENVRLTFARLFAEERFLVGVVFGGALISIIWLIFSFVR
jgi:anti-sigma factor RsiW